MKLSRGRSLIAITLGLCAVAVAQSGVERRDGFIPMLWDADSGKLMLEITQFDKDILYYTEIAKGSGSGSVGFEWAGGGEGGVIQFQRVGPRVLVVEKNTSFRAGTGGPGMEKGVDASFPDSVLGSLPITKSENGKVTVDATAFFVRDAVGFGDRNAGGRGGGGGRGGERAQGTAWTFDATRSAIYLPRTKGFPKNTEVEVTVTYRATSGGARTTPESSILSGRLHYSFLDPPTGYKTRESDPRIGVGGVTFADYSTPNSEGKMIELVRRHRIEKKNPNAAMSDPKEPIVYYLDAAVPEPIRSAMKDGFNWWNKAFEAAGFSNALVIKDAPLDMDPMDVRYNQIYWVDRDERGYSTGGGLTDPRTGEIIAARVRLESDRVRTASSYWEAYKPGQTGDNHFFAPPAYSTPDTQVQMAQLREALLTAHEVGHSLGFGHNWNSSINNRASVMEYPSPRLKVAGGKIDVTDAWEKEIGAYDISMVRYAYTEFPTAKEKEGLEGVIQDMRKQGLIFTPSSDPRWNRYDDLDDPAEYLRQTIAQRKILMANYGDQTLLKGEAYGDLRGMRMWMTYLHHRWAIDSGVRYIGGMYLNYVMKGEANPVPPTEIVPAAKQREILGLMMNIIEPANMTMSESLLKLLTVETASRPRNAGGGPDIENLEGNLGAAFDHLTAARTLAGLVIDQIFEPVTANRLIAFADRQQNALTLPELIETMNKTVWTPAGDGMTKSIQRGTQRVYLDALMTLGANNQSTSDVKAVVMMEMATIKTTLAGMKDADPVTEAHLRQLERDATRYLNNPTAPRRTTPEPPVMAPI